MSRKVRDFTHQDLIRLFENNLSPGEKKLLLEYIDSQRLEQAKSWHEELNDFLTSLIPMPLADPLNELLKIALDWLWNKIDTSENDLDLEGCKELCERPLNKISKVVK